MEGTTLKKDGRPDSRPVMKGEALDVENDAFHGASSGGFPFSEHPNPC
jgi:hypothetical protein